MGKVTIISEEQKIILDEIGKNKFLCSNFYLSGGTALSEFYLRHRLSEDLDFFSQKPFGTQTIFTQLFDWSKKLNFTFRTQYVEPAYIANFVFPKQKKLKIDFVYFPFKRLEQCKKMENGLEVDSLFDIACNKLFTLTQRIQIKDLVDLYFLFDKYTVWDLIDGVKKKFNVGIDPLVIAADFLAVEDFDFLPKMIKPLALGDLKTFFLKKAKDLGKRGVE